MKNKLITKGLVLGSVILFTGTSSTFTFVIGNPLPIIYDDFEEGTLAKWNIISGIWEVIFEGNNKIAHLIIGTTPPYRRMVSVDSFVNNIIITAQIKGNSEHPQQEVADMPFGFYSDSAGNNYYFIALGYNNVLYIVKYSNGVEELLTYNNTIISGENIWYNIKIKLENTDIFAKRWELGGTEPTEWQISYSGATPFGTHILLGGANLVDNEELWYDNIAIEGENQPPVADFIWSPQNPNPGQTITFDASASYDPDGLITLYEWDWNNDGTYEESQAIPTTTHSWSNAGNYPVTLRITDDDLIPDIETKTVNVGGENQPFYFVHITDPHVTKNQKDIWEADIKQLRDIVLLPYNTPPDFILCTGDLVDFGAQPEGAENYDSLLNLGTILYGSKPNFFIDSSQNIPIYFCPGNHDARDKNFILGSDPWLNSFDNYYTRIGSDYLTFSHKNCRIFSLNSGEDTLNDIHWLEWPEGDGLDNNYSNEISNFTRDLGLTEEEIKIVITHHPYKGPTKSNPVNGAFIKGRTDFIQACDDYGVNMVFCGHIHDENADKCPLVIGENTNQINTRSITNVGSNYYRIIEVNSLFYPEKGYHIDSMRQFSSTLSGDIYSVNMQNSMTTLDIYDESGNHNGLSGRGGIERQIPMSTYSFWELQNETLGINTTFTQFMLDKNDTKNYSVIIKSLFDDSINVTFFTSLIGGNWIRAEYVNVTMYNESIATVYANKSIFNYSMVIVDPDRTIRVVYPSYIEENQPPGMINIPVGPTFTVIGEICNYNITGIDPNDNDVYYWFDWGDGTNSSWLGPFNSNETIITAHSWNFRGTYKISVKTKDDYSLENNWSEPFVVHVINESDLKPTLMGGLISNVIEGMNFTSFNARIILSLKFSPSFDFRIYKNLELIVVSDDHSGFIGSRWILGRFNALYVSESLSTTLHPLHNRFKKLT